jgi:phosphate starvation-inducible protein PhoH
VNFENKIVIIDEAQNMYLDEMQKTLTRAVDNCKMIVIGHAGQCDLYKNPFRSGFTFYKEWYKNTPRTAICELVTNHRGWISKHADSLDVVALCEYLEKNKNKNIHIDLNDFKIM